MSFLSRIMSFGSRSGYQPVPSTEHKKSISADFQGISSTMILPPDGSLSEKPEENRDVILKIFQRIHGREKDERLEVSRVLTPAHLIHYIERGADVNLADANGHTSLHFAAKIGRSDLVKTLLEANAQKDARGPDGYTALHLSAYQGHKEAVEELLTDDADTMLPSVLCPEDLGKHTNCLPLHFACGRGHFFAAIPLIVATKDLQAVTSSGWTALHFAALSGSTQIAEALLKTKKFDVRSLTGEGKSLVAIAEANNHTRFSEFIKRYYPES